MKFITQKTRSLIEISGPENKKFLQGLITNDINKISETSLLYSAMLNAQGRFLYDFFIFAINDKIILDCYAEKRDEIIKKLNFYKLRSQVVIAKNDDLIVATSEMPINTKNSFIDPRHKNLGFRAYLPRNSDNFSDDESPYHFLRIKNKIPESELDLTHEKSFILEFDFDHLNAIDYQKGCYVGQETTARTHYKGQIRKKLFHIIIENLQNIDKNSEITCEGNSAGIVLSSVFYQNQLHALALIKISEENSEIKNLTFEQNKISIVE